MTVELLGISAATYEPHALHSTERIWTETNCYIDLWVEVLHALGLDPLAAGAFTLSTDFEGDQWTFFKYPPEDLRAVYGIDVAEMGVWQSLETHAIEQLELGRLITMECDSFHLPDTAGVAYQLDHVKTTIVPERIDQDGRQLGYFHNAGYFELEGDDFDAVFRRGAHDDPTRLDPYVELVKLDGVRRDDVTDVALRLTADHLRRRPSTNPIQRLRKRLPSVLEWLPSRGIDQFHRWAFVFCRQCGASAEFAAAYIDWLAARHGDVRDSSAASDLRQVATDAKALEFSLARAVRGRVVDVEPLLDSMELRWDSAMTSLVARYG